MCKKTNYKTPNPRIDKCMRNLIRYLKFCSNLKVVACCCGHGKYPMTIVVEWMPEYKREIISDTIITRKRKFYKRDKQGYYYIPEVVNNAD